MTGADSYAVEALLSGAGQRGPARVRFHNAGAELTLADGRRLELPYAHAQLAYGGAKDDVPIVTLVAADDEVVRLYFEQDRKLFAAPPTSWPEAMRTRAGQLGKGRSRVWLALPITAALLVALWFSGGLFVELMVRLVPRSAEPPLGKIFADATVAGKVEDDELLNAAVNRIGQALVVHVPDNPYPFRFRVVKMPIENAFAFPGGEVLVTTGLLAEASSADELAGVLGHEVQHVLQRHATKRIVQEVGLGIGFAMLIGDVGTVGVIAASYGKDLIGMAFGRDQELESDRLGLRLSHRAGFDPRGLAAFFKRLKGEDGASVPAILSTHPAHDDRLAQIDRIAAELGPVKAADRPRLPDWAEVRRRAGGGGEAPKKRKPAT